MVCYIFPTIGAILVYSHRKINKKNDGRGRWLAHLLLGGSAFGIIDHLWNGELFLIGPQPLKDILLGVTITVSIFAIWYAMVVYSQVKAASPQAAEQ